ncbi:hypothetical protein Mgra_00001148, partial [Meloidogyne graminicola]
LILSFYNSFGKKQSRISENKKQRQKQRYEQETTPPTLMGWPKVPSKNGRMKNPIRPIKEMSPIEKWYQKAYADERQRLRQKVTTKKTNSRNNYYFGARKRRLSEKAKTFNLN